MSHEEVRQDWAALLQATRPSLPVYYPVLAYHPPSIYTMSATSRIPYAAALVDDLVSSGRYTVPPLLPLHTSALHTDLIDPRLAYFTAFEPQHEALPQDTHHVLRILPFLTVALSMNHYCSECPDCETLRQQNHAQDLERLRVLGEARRRIVGEEYDLAIRLEQQSRPAEEAVVDASHPAEPPNATETGETEGASDHRPVSINGLHPTPLTPPADRTVRKRRAMSGLDGHSHKQPKTVTCVDDDGDNDGEEVESINTGVVTGSSSGYESCNSVKDGNGTNIDRGSETEQASGEENEGW